MGVAWGPVEGGCGACLRSGVVRPSKAIDLDTAPSEGFGPFPEVSLVCNAMRMRCGLLPRTPDAYPQVVLVTELVGPDYRGRVGILTQSFFIAGGRRGVRVRVRVPMQGRRRRRRRQWHGALCCVCTPWLAWAHNSCVHTCSYSACYIAVVYPSPTPKA